MNRATKQEYFIVVDDGEVERMAWTRSLAKRVPEENFLVTESVRAAIKEWNRLYMADHIPRAIIVDWNLGTSFLRSTSEGIRRSGAQYLLHHCIDMSEDIKGTFAVYTGDPESALKALEADPIVGPRVIVIDKDRHTPTSALVMLSRHRSFTSQEGCPSGLYCVTAGKRELPEGGYA